ncbi:MAG: phosphomannomutase/phosphoglucomutase [Candidatus Latescibacteria bacterium]|nr:phosphomannomutase/phosphoglucomutase [Candidatus Latescibacterota bacterium]NIO27230.1 phosphomannomutase/phosphoglucomutase [Candidatus Latescibacterota bacterium]NIO54754.1 phosphomannomutase/phosphoglucomutase [Candidatus Latescibacterota bacterium]NIT00837.1 phosphomannomutase/phosphoglucomutase [Candidatus Latescibacterota bacterium]NIT37760.1 phosphomannomutase/phosphoglucomutase [Candidatus Latescibacterota bacterium]
MAHVERSMFREYDIRGRVNDKELNPTSGELIGRAYGTFLEKRGVDSAVVGYDCRVGSEEIREGVIKGLLSTGRRVVDLGMCLTPMMYWSQYRFEVKGGAMITGSHNPKGWSGLKLAFGCSYTLIGEELEEILGYIERENFTEGRGEREAVSILEDYAADLTGRVTVAKPLKIVVDAGNGTAGMVAPPVLRKAGCEVVEQFCDLDPEFPNHEPDPALKLTLEVLGKRVIEEGADVGFAFDGDGDRLGMVDENGQVIWPDRYMILLSRQVLEKSPGGKVVFDVKCSQALEEDIAAHGGIPIMWKTGHSHIKAKLHEEKGLLAGEMSGHIFFVENYYGFDDGVYAGLRFAEYISNQSESLSKIIDSAPYYVSTPTIHVDCPDGEKYRVVDELTAAFKRDFPRVIDINGARVMFDDGWGLVRASSNMPQLVLRFEAKTEERLEELKTLFRNYMDKYEEIGREWENE